MWDISHKYISLNSMLYKETETSLSVHNEFRNTMYNLIIFEECSYNCDSASHSWFHSKLYCTSFNITKKRNRKEIKSVLMRKFIMQKYIIYVLYMGSLLFVEY